VNQNFFAYISGRISREDLERGVDLDTLVQEIESEEEQLDLFDYVETAEVKRERK
jgi:hypothetical protein